ncbi:hypothetical protein J6590_055100 [Homalodisca vitripennis]|nr:hypothetical protein J6590_055100 [Homalodisca vitripennis]
MAVPINRWPSARKASMLCLSLRGDALGVLQTIPIKERLDSSKQQSSFITTLQLKSSLLKNDEPLQEFKADIARLSIKAFPSIMEDFNETGDEDRTAQNTQRDIYPNNGIRRCKPICKNLQLVSKVVQKALEALRTIRKGIRIWDLVNTLSKDPVFALQSHLLRVGQKPVLTRRDQRKTEMLAPRHRRNDDYHDLGCSSV